MSVYWTVDPRAFAGGEHGFNMGPPIFGGNASQQNPIEPKDIQQTFQHNHASGGKQNNRCYIRRYIS